ncbi:cation:proton antiporter [Legionella sainthelensi]|uniref:cation:proton antiporter n=1 Tax=Legionella sainthelensi TaxID=28087 RepID=UPI000E1FC79D|nr:cation:proton antiporter [Legionella sainthelensi]
MKITFLHEPAVLFLMMLFIVFFMPLLSRLIYIPSIIGLIIGGIICGPHVLNLLPLTPSIELFASIGVIYLMFTVGLEINLDQLISNRARTFIFYLLTYLLPLTSALLIGWIFGLDINSSILLGAIYASYTLVAYPIITELGILKNEAVAISVSAVVLTDITALITLIVSLHIHSGNTSFVSLSLLALSLILYAAFVLLSFPYIAKLFFRYSNSKQSDFAFLLASLAIAVILGKAIGINMIIGAFLAGLAINRVVSKESGAVKQTLFLGESLFVPLFLVSIGVRLNPMAIFLSWKSLVLGLSLTLAVYVTKFAAAWIASYLFRYSRQQMMVIWGLSQAQAAATLVIILIGINAHLFPEYFLNGIIIMILFTLFTSPLLVKYYGSKIRPTAKINIPLFKRIITPVEHNDFPDNVINFSARLARYGDGKLLILNIAENECEIQEKREKLRAGPMKDPDTDIELINQIEKNIPKIILNEVIESETSFIIMNWSMEEHKRGCIFSSNIDHVMWTSTVPVAAALLKMPIKGINRVISVIGAHAVGVKFNEQYLDVVVDISKALGLPLTTITTNYYHNKLNSKFEKIKNLDFQFIKINGDIIEAVSEIAKENDLIIIPSMNHQKRFDTNKNYIPYGLLQHTESSLIIIHLPK